jgi:hypothetical protein
MLPPSKKKSHLSTLPVDWQDTDYLTPTLGKGARKGMPKYDPRWSDPRGSGASRRSDPYVQFPEPPPWLDQPGKVSARGVARGVAHGVGRGRKVSEWNRHVSQVYQKMKRKHPSATFKQAVAKASSSYRRR